MLTQVYELLKTQLHIFSINFINVVSIRCLVLPALFLSVSMVYIDYMCITSVTEYSKSIRLLLKIIRTSDSLNEGLPIKMTREKFQRKRYFFYEKDSRFNPRLIHESSFLIGQVPIEKYGMKTLFLLFNI